ISESTVKTHVKAILRKLGASNRAEAVARWHGATRQP
ncbi:MAG: response regulator transcription factor, partial [Actinomycetales bacterium]